jgi:5'-3' exonuclease
MRAAAAVKSRRRAETRLSGPMSRALLLDTHALLFRAFFALPPMTTKAGEPTSALYGLAVMLLKLLRDERPRGLAFALDAAQPTFRHLQSGSYKAHRPPLPDALRRQLDVLPRLLEAVGAPTSSRRGSRLTTSWRRLPASWPRRRLRCAS